MLQMHITLLCRFIEKQAVAVDLLQIHCKLAHTNEKDESMLECICAQFRHA